MPSSQSHSWSNTFRHFQSQNSVICLFVFDPFQYESISYDQDECQKVAAQSKLRSSETSQLGHQFNTICLPFISSCLNIQKITEMLFKIDLELGIFKVYLSDKVNSALAVAGKERWGGQMFCRSGSGVSLLVTLCRGVCYPDALVLRLKFLYFAAIQPVFNYGIQEYHTLWDINADPISCSLFIESIPNKYQFYPYDWGACVVVT